MPSPRLDIWLFYARFFKTRSLATREVQAGHVRLNGLRTTKPAQAVGTGDVLTFPQGDRIRVVRVLALGLRRGPATEAQRLYDDLSPPVSQTAADTGPEGARKGGRPTKKDRRATDRLQYSDDDGRP